MIVEIVNKTALKLWHCQITWYLFAGFKTIILCSIHSIQFVKYVFSAKIWFVKTSTKIVKYESRVVKSNLGLIVKFHKILLVVYCKHAIPDNFTNSQENGSENVQSCSLTTCNFPKEGTNVCVFLGILRGYFEYPYFFISN